MIDYKMLSPVIAMAGELPAGTVCLVGAGPGDSALISVKGAVRLAQADVVLHDKLIGPELLDLVRADCQRVFVGKWRGTHVWTQDQINQALVEHARAGKRVVRLKGGDPFVFGRGGEECDYLARHGVSFEVIPGITAAFGAPATAGIPLTHRGLSRSFALVTGHADHEGDEAPLDYAALVGMETIAIYMGVKNLAANCERLVAAGKDPDTPVAVIRWGTRPAQRTAVGTLGTIAAQVTGQGIQPPALVLIGEVVRMRDSIEWFEGRPLHGQTVVVTRMRDQAQALSSPLLALGAEVIEAPTIALGPLDDYTDVDAALRNLQRYDWLVLTSVNGVDALFERLTTIGLDSRALAGLQIASVGPATTRQLECHGIKPDLMPAEAVGEALAEALIGHGAASKRVLLLRAEIARKALTDSLHASGAFCDDLAVYRTVCPEALPPAFVQRLESREVHWITVTSPSSWYNLLSMLGPDRSELLYNVKLASIGPISTQAIRERGYRETVQADPHDIPGLVAAIVKDLTGRSHDLPNASAGGGCGYSPDESEQGHGS